MSDQSLDSDMASCIAINKSMDKDDLFSPSGAVHVQKINDLINDVYRSGLAMTSWYGSLPHEEMDLAAGGLYEVGRTNRGDAYEPLTGAADDARLPWYLYWEIVWVMQNGPSLSSKSRILDAGGTASLFSCYLASLGHEVHSIDLNYDLVSAGKKLADAMKWDMHSYVMNMTSLSFPDQYFEHAYSICVFEHLAHELKQAALREIARVLMPGGILSITFDFCNPAPYVVGIGSDDSIVNQLNCGDDLRRAFLSTGLFEMVGNADFFDNGKRYLVHPRCDNKEYSFGCLFLRRL